MHDLIYDSCNITTFVCTPQIRACFDCLNLKKSTSSVEANIEQGKRKGRLSEVNKMLLPHGIVDLMQILQGDKLNIGSKVLSLS